MENTAATLSRESGKTEGKYLTFLLDNEEYGIEVVKVREIIGYLPITPVPQMPEYIKGVINLRGQVIPVVDIRTRLGMVAAEPTDETCIVVVEIRKNDKSVSTGLIVDKVKEVLNISDDQIEDKIEFGTGINTEFILGIGKSGKSVKILLNIDKILSVEELSATTADNEAGAEK